MANWTTRSVTVGIIALLLTVAAAPVHAGRIHSVCLVAESPEVRAALADALNIERRKAGRGYAIHTAAAEDACGSEDGGWLVVTVSPDETSALLATGREAPETLPLEGLTDEDRVVVVAERTARRAAETERPEIELADLPSPPPPERPARTRPSRRTLGVSASLGGRYLSDIDGGSGTPGMDGEVALTLKDGRVAIGLFGGWSVDPSLSDGAVAADLSAGEVGAVVRGGFRFERWLLRGGLGVGLLWRSVDVRSEDAAERRTARSSFGLAELETAWLATEHFWLAAAFLARVHFEGTDYRWDGRLVFEAPRATLGGALRVGVRF